MAALMLDNIGSGNGFMPDGNKPLPEPMLTYHHWHISTFIRGRFHNRYLSHLSTKLVWQLLLPNVIQGQWVNRGNNTVTFVVNKLFVPIMLMAWFLGLPTQYQSVYLLWLRYIYMWRFATGYSFCRHPCLTHSVVFDSRIRVFMTSNGKRPSVTN